MVCPLPITHLPLITSFIWLVRVPLPPPPPQQKNNNKQTNKQTNKKIKTQKQGPPRQKKKKKKKKKERDLSLRILPRRTRLLTSLHKEKARKAWPTATIIYEILIFIEIYVCQKY